MTIHYPIARLRTLLQQERSSPASLAAAAEALFGHRDSEAVVSVLLPLLQHAEASVRVCAIHGLSAHPYPNAIKALDVLAREDASLEVRAAATKALEDFETAGIECIQCEMNWAKLAPEPSSDPHEEQFPRPMFCGEACAVAWALDNAPDEYHLCVTKGRWARGPRADCDRCNDADLVGEPDPEAAT